MSSFDTAIKGLNAQSAAIQVTSSNIANASTVGYKSRESLFVDEYFKAVPTGAEAGTRRLDSQGAMKATSSALDLAVQGTGMFCLTSQVSGDAAASTYYSRNGSFAVNKEGYIVNSNGLFLNGYQPNATRTGATNTMGALMMPPAMIDPMASTSGIVAANLDAREAGAKATVGGVSVPKPFLASDPSTYSASTSVNVFDAKGVAHQVSLYFKKIDNTVVDDPRSLTTPKATATASQFEVYMEGDGVTMLRSPAGNAGSATLGAAADTAAAHAQALYDAYVVAQSAAGAADGNYGSAVAVTQAAKASRDAALVRLAAVTPSPALASASPRASDVVSAASALSSANSDLAQATAQLGVLRSAQSAAAAAVANDSPTSSEHQVLIDARNAADAALAAFTLDPTAAGSTGAPGPFVMAQNNQVVAQTAFNTALTNYAAVPALTDSTAISDAEQAVGAISAYNSAVRAVEHASANEAESLAALGAANAEALRAAETNSTAVEASRIGTLQFVEGQLLGSLTKSPTTGQAADPTLFNVQLADDKGNGLFDVSIDLSQMTAFGSGFAVTKNSSDGNALGALSGFSVDETGTLRGQYTNGETLVAGQLALATFQSPDQLTPASGSVFNASFASGDPVLGTATSGSFGAVRSSSLEQSTTDMAAELVNLMLLQRNYQANSQTLQAANTLLTTAINMGR